MALWYCAGCTTAYAVGLLACPQCGGTEHADEPVRAGAVVPPAEPVAPLLVAEAGPELVDLPEGPEKPKRRTRDG